MFDRRRATTLVLLLSLAPLGCPRADTDRSATPEPNASVEPKPNSGDSTPAAPQGLCGIAGERFGDFEWIPSDTRLTTAIERRDPELPAALTSLVRMADGGELQLPIRAALDYRNLGFQLLGIDATIQTLELDPGELVELHDPKGDVIWAWPTSCETVTVAARLLDRLTVMVRLDFEHPGIRIGAGSPSFPFDVVLVHDRMIALTPLGRGAHVSAWLSAPRLHDDGPGVALASIDPAPIRSVLSGSALLDEPDRAGPVAIGHRKIRVTASEWAELESVLGPDAPD